MNPKKSTAISAISLLVLLSFVVAIIVPLNGFVIDIVIAVSLAISITIYMRANTITDWKDLKMFPTLLLLSAIFRIAIGIATTKQILLTGDAGNLIQSAGHYIVGGNIWVGVVVFILLIVVQFIIANGASRTSEVSARFTLDKIPGKQMSIDADLQSGLITEQEAKERRKELDLEIEFYGNMDGASKFIKGDVIAGLILIIVNIVFGFILGILVQGMEFGEAAMFYTILTIGDGLVTQLSSLLVTVAAGIVLTRVYDGEENVTETLFKELTYSPIVLYLTGSVFLALGVFTELPFIPLVFVGGIAIYIAYTTQQRQALAKEEEIARKRLRVEEEGKMRGESIEVLTGFEPITLEIGVRLIPLVNLKQKGETLADRITLLRKRVGVKLGVRIPSIHLIDNPSLNKNEYRISVRDVCVAKVEIRPDKLLAIKSNVMVKDFDKGIPTKDPIYGSDAIWIDDVDVNTAKSMGYIVNDALAVLTLHLTEMIYKHIHELMSRQEVKDLLDNLEGKNKVLLDEIKKKDVSLSLIQKVLCNLLKERISIRDLSGIVEAVTDAVDIYQNIDDITGMVRERIARQICEVNGDEKGNIYTIFLSKEIEDIEKFENHLGYHFNLNMEQEKALMLGLKQQIDKAQMAGVEPTIVANTNKTRASLMKLLQKYDVQKPIMTNAELVPDAWIKKIGIAEMMQQS